MSEQLLIILSVWWATSMAFIFYIIWVSENRRIIGDNYMTRFFLIPRNRFFNIYLHKYTGSDHDLALHDHPWHSLSFLIKGTLQEYQHLKAFSEYKDKATFDMLKITSIWKFIPKYRSPTYSHRLELMSKTAWTIFFTGPVVREWGFICRKGWVHWKQFTDSTGNFVGRGCD